MYIGKQDEQLMLESRDSLKKINDFRESTNKT